jgi:Ras of Complex, Roc, domain of DAPkinase/WD domain, G-beta repeat
VAWSPDGRLALSGSEDNTVRIWEVPTRRSLRVLEGHSDRVASVAWSPDGRFALSAADNGVMRIWDWIPELGADDQLEYANAKVLLVGDSGVGKTGLSMRLAGDQWKPSDSTLGAWATQWPIPSQEGPEREIWLWDFGGQADQRLVHQFYMEDTAVAVLVFDAQKNEVFETLGNGTEISHVLLADRL